MGPPTMVILRTLYWSYFYLFERLILSPVSHALMKCEFRKLIACAPAEQTFLNSYPEAVLLILFFFLSAGELFIFQLIY